MGFSNCHKNHDRWWFGCSWYVLCVVVVVYCCCLLLLFIVVYCWWWWIGIRKAGHRRQLILAIKALSSHASGSGSDSGSDSGSVSSLAEKRRRLTEEKEQENTRENSQEISELLKQLAARSSLPSSLQWCLALHHSRVGVVYKEENDLLLLMVANSTQLHPEILHYFLSQEPRYTILMLRGGILSPRQTRYVVECLLPDRSSDDQDPIVIYFSNLLRSVQQFTGVNVQLTDLDFGKLGSKNINTCMVYMENGYTWFFFLFFFSFFFFLSFLFFVSVSHILYSRLELSDIPSFLHKDLFFSSSSSLSASLSRLVNTLSKAVQILETYVVYLYFLFFFLFFSYTIQHRAPARRLRALRGDAPSSRFQFADVSNKAQLSRIGRGGTGGKGGREAAPQQLHLR